ncbi:MutH/Sau3AI family endonuclease (plasmid) [Lactiplantibacillus plantarum]|uniref:MutH/Sau3AI family endonuclease n=1 Tax=Lactiplantibacillus plantarum TaxID=1590 RepID=UPI000D109550|nr:MutH/Sau3AI family endonuclease [Lactiplantibacillus plantarum]MCG0714448.1 DNA mismatch repair protein MutH [Lactiplantibacillus plantarum]MCG0758503.1 DNA mismatch repair protein MutH [Lactiplantibacillus plantarum]MCG0896364.1 DNA mismatch repair protein MutH [Lactiplantibacillus plantarum]UZD35037.1 MutH/Sau3AI family endonuclease [Lactiplantibacillus plantarum]WHQ52919.1 hypothetical protein M1852_15390 [Lactiplantibacillus plantarum]
MNTGQSQLQADILKRISGFVGQSDVELFRHFNIRPNINGKYAKRALASLINCILDLDINKERAKALQEQGIKLKTIHVNGKGMPKESMSFPNFDFRELVSETWQSSKLREQFVNTTYLFVVFTQLDVDSFQFRGVKFWKMPKQDLDGTVHAAWDKVVATLNQGVDLSYDAKRNRVTNNLLAQSDHMIIHVRPHTSKSSYYAGSNYGNQLPVAARWTNKPADFSDNWMTKQSFWLNKDYLLDQIKDLL